MQMGQSGVGRKDIPHVPLVGTETNKTGMKNNIDMFQNIKNIATI